MSLQRLIGGWTRNKLDCDISLHIGSPTNYMQNVVYPIFFENANIPNFVAMNIKYKLHHS